VTRYGKDSPYLDVVLPCGSGLDILFSGADLTHVTAQVSALHMARQTAFIAVRPDNSLAVSATADSDKAMAYTPEYRLHTFGAGLQLISFAELAQAMNYQIIAHSNDEASLTTLAEMGIEAQPMTHQSKFDSADFDAFSAVITLFHEHEMETAILQAALDSQAHYIGALGSRKTHEQRRDLLQTGARPFEDIIGPVGLDIGATDPSEIALSILAQIVEKRRR
jgi:xanthine dehydrogenase accessory factor